MSIANIPLTSFPAARNSGIHSRCAGDASEMYSVGRAYGHADPSGRKEVIRAARALNEVENVTVILITHYMEEVIYAIRCRYG